MKKNIQRLADDYYKLPSKYTRHYSITIDEIKQIAIESKHEAGYHPEGTVICAIMRAFAIGYMQGRKAMRKEMEQLADVAERKNKKEAI